MQLEHGESETRRAVERSKELGSTKSGQRRPTENAQKGK